MLSRRAISGPTIASATVSRNGNHAIGGNHTISAAGCAGVMPKMRATAAAAAATISTRRYCMIETSRGSAPYASAIRVITEAAPGLVPHSAVVPGSICSRVMIQPTRVLTATTDSTPTENSTQWLTTSPTIEMGTILAIMLPTMPCANTKGASGRLTRAPAVAIAIEASSGPSSSAAGAWTWVSNAAAARDAAISNAH